MIYAPMYGRIRDVFEGYEHVWLTELNDDGTQRQEPCVILIPEKELPDVVPIWTIRLPTRFHDTPCEGPLLDWKMRRAMAIHRGRDSHRRYWSTWDEFYGPPQERITIFAISLPD